MVTISMESAMDPLRFTRTTSGLLKRKNRKRRPNYLYKNKDYMGGNQPVMDDFAICLEKGFKLIGPVQFM